MPFGVELWIYCILTMVRNLRSGATVGGDGEFVGAKTKKKRTPHWKYDRSEIRAAVGRLQGRTEVCCETYIQGFANKI